jgi:hypothetical protein
VSQHLNGTLTTVGTNGEIARAIVKLDWREVAAMPSVPLYEPVTIIPTAELDALKHHGEAIARAVCNLLTNTPSGIEGKRWQEAQEALHNYRTMFPRQ